MSAINRFVKVDVDPAVAWLTLDSDTRLLGPALALRFGNGGLLPDITLDELPDVLCRDLAVDAKKRPAFRQRIAKLIAKRLLVETSEGVQLLWSRDAFKAHARPKLEVVRAPAEVPANDQAPATHRPPIDHPSATHPKLSVRNQNVHPPVERERERDLKPPTEVPAARAAERERKPVKTDPRRPLWDRLLDDAGKRHGFIAKSLLGAKYTRAVIAKATEHAERAGVPLEAAMVRMLDDAHERHTEFGKDLKWCLVDWQPNAPKPKKWASSYRKDPPLASTAKDFGGDDEAEALLQKLLAEDRELARVGT